jgi:hypothetical protein
VDDARAGLRLCPSDINPGNFKKCPDGTVVALDFCATCFLPPSFFAVAIQNSIGSFSTWADFAEKVAKLVNYPQSSDVWAMVTASHRLIPYGRDDIGQPDIFSLTWTDFITGQEFLEASASARDSSTLPFL